MLDAPPITEAAEREAIAHGGDLAAIRRAYPDAPEPWIDLSTGINPNAYPLPALPAALWTRLPEAMDASNLCRVAARRYRVPARASVIAAPGTQALIQALPELTERAGRVTVLGPTYEEHAASWRRGGHEVEMVENVERLAEADTAVLVNPNNPTGRHIAAATLEAVASKIAQRRGLLVVDEAFADLEPAGSSLAPVLPPRTIVLRSFGKTYGLAGLRLGFAIAGPDITARLAAALGPWAVSGPAIAIGMAALADEAWLDHQRAATASAVRRLDLCAARAGLVLKGGTSLFRLYAHWSSAEIAHRLANHGIHVRRFKAEPSWLRLGLPGEEAHWRRLEAALEG